jgi:hypothetical protein
MASIGYVYEFLQHNGAYAKQPLGDRPSDVPPVAGGAMRLTRDPITGRRLDATMQIFEHIFI